MIRPIIQSLFFLLAIAVVCTSCKTVPSPGVSDNNSVDKGNIIFVNLKISKDKDGIESIRLVDRAWSKGSLKKEKTNTSYGERGLTCIFLNGRKQEIKRMVVENPLKEQKESYSPDGTIQRNLLEIMEAGFTIRTEIPEDIYYLVIEDHSKKELGKIELR